MTAAETAPLVETAEEREKRSPWRMYAAFGTGVAIEILGDALEVALVRVRPGGPELLRRKTIERFHERPAAEWVNEFRECVKGHDPSGVTVLLPRRDVIVRQVSMPRVSKREMAAALVLRLRALHPFGEDDVAWCWAAVEGGAIVGITRQSLLGKYESLFAEAGIPVASFTCSATVLHSALRLFGRPARPFLGLMETAPGIIEAYGENTKSVIFTGEFSSAARAVSVGAAELRLPSNLDPCDLATLLPRRGHEGALNTRPLVYAAAIATACPLLVRPANFLPPERRAGQSRIWLIPTAVLALLLILATIAVFAVEPYRHKRYMQALEQEISRVQPAAQRSLALDARIAHERQQIETLDTFRGRSHADFEVLNELTRLLPPPAWASLVEVYPDYVIIAGEAEQAAPLLKIIDSSPLFQNSEFTNSVVRAGSNELFRIKTYRRRK
jgi:Tfp pilus assembly protein PilN